MLCYYDTVTGKKRPKYPNWLRMRPNFADVARHLAEDENNLIGIIPESVDAIVVDVDHGDWKATARKLGSAVSNATLRRRGCHIWMPVNRHSGRIQNHGFAMHDGAGAFVASGDLRFRNSYVIVWNKKSVDNALRMAQIRDGAPTDQTMYRAAIMRKHRATPTSSGGTMPAWLHYAALYDGQMSAVVRHDRMVANALEARRLWDQGWRVKELIWSDTNGRGRLSTAGCLRTSIPAGS